MFKYLKELSGLLCFVFNLAAFADHYAISYDFLNGYHELFCHRMDETGETADVQLEECLSNIKFHLPMTCAEFMKMEDGADYDPLHSIRLPHRYSKFGNNKDYLNEVYTNGSLRITTSYHSTLYISSLFHIQGTRYSYGTMFKYICEHNPHAKARPRIPLIQLKDLPKVGPEIEVERKLEKLMSVKKFESEKVKIIRGIKNARRISEPSSSHSLVRSISSMSSISSILVDDDYSQPFLFDLKLQSFKEALKKEDFETFLRNSDTLAKKILDILLKKRTTHYFPELLDLNAKTEILNELVSIMEKSSEEQKYINFYKVMSFAFEELCDRTVFMKKDYALKMTLNFLVFTYIATPLRLQDKGELAQQVKSIFSLNPNSQDWFESLEDRKELRELRERLLESLRPRIDGLLCLDI